MKLRLAVVADEDYNMSFRPQNGINFNKFVKSYKREATAIGYEHKVIFEPPDDLPINHSYGKNVPQSYESAVKRYIRILIQKYNIRKETIKIIILKKAYKPELNKLVL